MQFIPTSQLKEKRNSWWGSFLSNVHMGCWDNRGALKWHWTCTLSSRPLCERSQPAWVTCWLFSVIHSVVVIPLIPAGLCQKWRTVALILGALCLLLVTLPTLHIGYVRLLGHASFSFPWAFFSVCCKHCWLCRLAFSERSVTVLGTYSLLLLET